MTTKANRRTGDAAVVEASSVGAERPCNTNRPPPLQAHPLAELLPPVEGEEFAALVEDIRVHGLREPVVLHEGKILDGRTRYRACIEAGVDCRFEHYAGNDAAAFVISLNVRRRHLSAEQRREIIEKLIKVNPEQSNGAIASTVHADHKTVGSVRAKLEGRGEIPHVEKRVDTRGRGQ